MEESKEKGETLLSLKIKQNSEMDSKQQCQTI